MIAAYIRVSTDEQADKGNSLNEQQERLSAYCKAMNWGEPVFYIDDGYSAKDLNRPAIKKLLEDVKQDKVRVILTTKLDRLSRNLLDLLQTVEFLSDHNCSYISASESFDTSTAVGRMTLQLLGTFAEFERERISERVKDNMLSLARNTNKAISRPCFGYDIVNGQYTINEEEAKFVRLMFEWAEQGHGHRMIAKMLNDLGSVTKKGKMWDQVNVKRLMQNDALAGRLVYNKRQVKNGKRMFRDTEEWIVKENNHPAIISPEQFEKVQEIMKSRARAAKHADSETYLLTGLVKCVHCGKNMKGSTSRHKRKNGDYTYYRYICSSYVLGYDCKYHAVHRDDLEHLIINEVKMIASTSTKKLRLKVSAPSVDEEIAALKIELAKIDKRMQKQIEAFERDLISDEDLKQARERIDLERSKVREQIKKLESRTGDPATVKESAKTLLPEITGIDRLAAKRALRNLIDRIDVENGELISITWKV